MVKTYESVNTRHLSPAGFTYLESQWSHPRRMINHVVYLLLGQLLHVRDEVVNALHGHSKRYLYSRTELIAQEHRKVAGHLAGLSWSGLTCSKIPDGDQDCIAHSAATRLAAFGPMERRSVPPVYAVPAIIYDYQPSFTLVTCGSSFELYRRCLWSLSQGLDQYNTVAFHHRVLREAPKQRDQTWQKANPVRFHLDSSRHRPVQCRATGGMVDVRG